MTFHFSSSRAIACNAFGHMNELNCQYYSEILDFVILTSLRRYQLTPPSYLVCVIAGAQAIS